MAVTPPVRRRAARSAPTRVPFVDLKRVHEPLRKEILADVGALIDSSAFVNGPAVGEFERAFAAYCGRRQCVGVSSGLDAIRLGLLALGVGPHDEVIVPANTFIATIEAITQVGARPVLVDASEDDYNLDVAAAAAAVGRKTVCILPVHLYGQLADMRAVAELAHTRGLGVVEDACQAHGASRDGYLPGDASACAAFSFYPGKNLGAIGDAGAAVTDSEAFAGTLRALREHGQATKGRHDLPGWTARLDTLQASVLMRKLRHLSAWNKSRQRAARFYNEMLDGVGDLVLPPVARGSNHVWHLYVVRTADPEALAAHLAVRGIGTGRHYPQPPHLSQAYAALGHERGEFPVSEALADQGLSLPIFPEMRLDELEQVVAGVRSYFRRA